MNRGSGIKVMAGNILMSMVKFRRIHILAFFGFILSKEAHGHICWVDKFEYISGGPAIIFDSSTNLHLSLIGKGGKVRRFEVEDGNNYELEEDNFTHRGESISYLSLDDGDIVKVYGYIESSCKIIIEKRPDGYELKLEASFNLPGSNTMTKTEKLEVKEQK